MAYYHQSHCPRCDHKQTPREIPQSQFEAVKKHSDTKETTWGEQPMIVVPTYCNFCR